MALGLVMILSLAMPSYASSIILPTALDGHFAILNNGSVTFTGDSTLSGTVTIGVGAVEYLIVAGGGGGGATQAGANATTSSGGKGGDGYDASAFLGTGFGDDGWFAGGGGGGKRTSGSGGSGGKGGGASAPVGSGSNPGQANTGGGGAGSAGSGGATGGEGGSGAVHIGYAGDGAGATGGSVSSFAGKSYTLHSYTSGTSSFSLPTGFDASAQHAIISGDLSGSGGLNVAGPGTLVLSGNNDYAGATTVSSGIMVIDGTHTGAGAFTVANGAAIGGGGSIGSDLTLEEGANFWWDGVSKLDVAGTGTVSILGNETFGVDSLVGFDWADIALGNYILIDNDSDFAAMSLNHWGFENRLNVGVDKYAYFSQGSLQLNVVPEPSALGLLGIGLVTMYGLRRRRCA